MIANIDSLWNIPRNTFSRSFGSFWLGVCWGARSGFEFCSLIVWTLPCVHSSISWSLPGKNTTSLSKMDFPSSFSSKQRKNKLNFEPFWPWEKENPGCEFRRKIETLGLFKQPSAELAVTSKSLRRPHMVFTNWICFWLFCWLFRMLVSLVKPLHGEVEGWKGLERCLVRLRKSHWVAESTPPQANQNQNSISQASTFLFLFERILPNYTNKNVQNFLFWETMP